jgi:two-component system, chemotaxis family, chemotaxis protein CheY
MNKKILLVDDWEQIRDLIKQMLTNMKFEVITAVDGRDALEKIAIEKPDLILSDVEMPLLDGIGLAKAVLPGIPVILMTGDLEKNRPKILAEGLDVKHILRKPFPQMDLLMAILDHIKIG